MPGADLFVCHPARQHSHELALALHERQRLAVYLTGLPTQPTPWLARWWPHTPVALPAARVRVRPIAAIGRKLTAFLGGDVAVRGEYWGYRSFDRWCARAVKRMRPRAVVCYENAALETFRAARSSGAHCILDAASVHHTLQDACVAPRESPGLHRRITAAKDAELALADAVLVCSDMAARSYVAAGVPATRVHRLRLGVDTRMFRPAARRERGSGVRFAFVGAARPLKGFDLLLGAITEVRTSHPETTLTVFGHAGGYPEVAGVLRRGHLGHAQLAAELAQCDCLVLPSRFDSFGLVVLEAMACGLPVICSDRAGAAECVDEGINGWVVPRGDTAALARAMSRCVERQAELPALAAAARHTAEQDDWSRYRADAARLIETLVG